MVRITKEVSLKPSPVKQALIQHDLYQKNLFAKNETKEVSKEKQSLTKKTQQK